MNSSNENRTFSSVVVQQNEQVQLLQQEGLVNQIELSDIVNDYNSMVNHYKNYITTYDIIELKEFYNEIKAFYSIIKEVCNNPSKHSSLSDNQLDLLAQIQIETRKVKRDTLSRIQKQDQDQSTQ